jgi:hypothetical protein
MLCLLTSNMGYKKKDWRQAGMAEVMLEVAPASRASDKC